ncbi:PREDICTED: dual specificity protein phosphatase 6-like [Amphimedon queenslandica]|uniref:protein-tyrosine-phosphatase n=1 Tax=Amphimedon queenslandica TaxID=400682 RepID=A0A1X7VVV2_AMPQE|nr:PREDICTED: dual specificity protein phosphatase 6-like [Amphimedon queenslandica]|eukprot:XP_011410132.1 PREDICTED: dual specificity protein phosphatase 6-like [Amphimedon queenslandica]
MMACKDYSNVALIEPHQLARNLHSREDYVLLDCRPVLAYNNCHISGAVNVNFTGLMKKRFIAGKIGLADLVTTEEGRERFRKSVSSPTVVYDEDTKDVKLLGSSTSISLVLAALTTMGRNMFVLQGGLNAFGPLHPSLCEMAVPVPHFRNSLPPPPRASTPGMRDQALDWHTAPPVNVLSFLVLGSEKDARSKLVFDWFNITYVLNVTPTCPNNFEGAGVVYKRIPVSDTGTQKLSNKFTEAFEYIEEIRKKNGVVLIHCMAGISRSVTLTIAYLMAHFGMSMQDAYQFVKDKRPAISPNLNFMGQLVEFERELQKNPSPTTLDIKLFGPSEEQRKKSVKLMETIIRTNSFTNLPPPGESSPRSKEEGGNTENSATTAGPTPSTSQTPFVLKPLSSSKSKRTKKYRESLEVQQEVAESVAQSSGRSNNNNTVTNSNGDTVTSNSVPAPTSDLSSNISSLHISSNQHSSSHPFPSNKEDTTSASTGGLPTKGELTVKGEKASLHERSVTPPNRCSPEKMEDKSPSPVVS